MRKLIALVVVAATLYGGYWFVGRSQIQSKLSEALVEIDAGPMDISYGSLNTKGFPSRFDTTFTDLVIDDPDARVRWETPIFQLLALSYQPNNVRAYFPQEQIIVVDGERFTLFSEVMEARGQVSASTALTFQQAQLDMTNPRLRTEEGAELALSRFRADIYQTQENERTYDTYFEAFSIVLPEVIRTLFDPENLQPPAIQNLRYEGQIDLTAPIELNGNSSVPVEIAALRIIELAFEWGEISLSAIGDVTPDEIGLLNGSFSISARNWQQVLDLAVATGAIPEDQRLLIVGMAASIDETPHVPDTLTATLSIVDGQMALGPIPLGAAPLLR